MNAYSSAFSLIELIVVMLVAGILATVVIVTFTGLNYQSNRVAANELRAHLTYVRNMALSRERATRVQFVSNSYRCAAITNYLNWTGNYLKDPATQKDWIVDLSNKFSGVTISSVSNISGNTLYFSETNGMPFSVVGFARMPLTATGVITFISGLKVTVAPVTGYADVE